MKAAQDGGNKEKEAQEGLRDCRKREAGEEWNYRGSMESNRERTGLVSLT